MISYINGIPLPKEVESRARPPKEVRAINKWLGVGQNSNILKNILKIAQAVRQSRKNKQNIAGMTTLYNLQGHS